MTFLVLPADTILEALPALVRAYEADTEPYPAPPATTARPRPPLGVCCDACGCLCRDDEVCPNCHPHTARAAS